MAIETYKRRNFISQILDIDNSHMFPLEVKIGVNNQLTLLLSVDGSSIVHGLISKYSHFLPLKDQLPEILGRLPKVQLQEMKGEAEELVVMNTTPVITEISENAINNQPRLKHIVFEEGLSKVNSHAFDTCDSLEKISFPKSLRELEDNIFHVCRNIKEIYLPGSCKVGRNVFPRRDSLIHFYDFPTGDKSGLFPTMVFQEIKSPSGAQDQDGIKATYYMGHATIYNIPFDGIPVCENENKFITLLSNSNRMQNMIDFSILDSIFPLNRYKEKEKKLLIRNCNYIVHYILKVVEKSKIKSQILEKMDYENFILNIDAMLKTGFSNEDITKIILNDNFELLGVNLETAFKNYNKLLDANIISKDILDKFFFDGNQILNINELKKYYDENKKLPNLFHNLLTRDYEELQNRITLIFTLNLLNDFSNKDNVERAKMMIDYTSFESIQKYDEDLIKKLDKTFFTSDKTPYLKGIKVPLYKSLKRINEDWIRTIDTKMSTVNNKMWTDFLHSLTTVKNWNNYLSEKERATLLKNEIIGRLLFADMLLSVSGQTSSITNESQMERLYKTKPKHDLLDILTVATRSTKELFEYNQEVIESIQRKLQRRGKNYTLQYPINVPIISAKILNEAKQAILDNIDNQKYKKINDLRKSILDFIAQKNIQRDGLTSTQLAEKLLFTDMLLSVSGQTQSIDSATEMIEFYLSQKSHQKHDEQKLLEISDKITNEEKNQKITFNYTNKILESIQTSLQSKEKNCNLFYQKKWKLIIEPEILVNTMLSQFPYTFDALKENPKKLITPNTLEGKFVKRALLKGYYIAPNDLKYANVLSEKEIESLITRGEKVSISEYLKNHITIPLIPEESRIEYLKSIQEQSQNYNGSPDDLFRICNSIYLYMKATDEVAIKNLKQESFISEEQNRVSQIVNTSSRKKLTIEEADQISKFINRLPKKYYQEKDKDGSVKHKQQEILTHLQEATTRQLSTNESEELSQFIDFIADELTEKQDKQDEDSQKKVAEAASMVINKESGMSDIGRLFYCLYNVNHLAHHSLELLYPSIEEEQNDKIISVKGAYKNLKSKGISIKLLKEINDKVTTLSNESSLSDSLENKIKDSLTQLASQDKTVAQILSDQGLHDDTRKTIQYLQDQGDNILNYLMAEEIFFDVKNKIAETVISRVDWFNPNKAVKIPTEQDKKDFFKKNGFIAEIQSGGDAGIVLACYCKDFADSFSIHLKGLSETQYTFLEQFKDKYNVVATTTIKGGLRLANQSLQNNGVQNIEFKFNPYEEGVQDAVAYKNLCSLVNSNTSLVQTSIPQITNNNEKQGNPEQKSEETATSLVNKLEKGKSEPQESRGHRR